MVSVDLKAPESPSLVQLRLYLQQQKIQKLLKIIMQNLNLSSHRLIRQRKFKNCPVLPSSLNFEGIRWDNHSGCILARVIYIAILAYITLLINLKV